MHLYNHFHSHFSGVSNLWRSLE